MSSFTAQYDGFKEIKTKTGKTMYALSFTGHDSVTSWEKPTESIGKTYFVNVTEKDVGGKTYQNLSSMIEATAQPPTNQPVKFGFGNAQPFETTQEKPRDVADLIADAHYFASERLEQLGLSYKKDFEQYIPLFELFFREFMLDRRTKMIQSFKKN